MRQTARGVSSSGTSGYPHPIAAGSDILGAAVHCDGLVNERPPTTIPFSGPCLPVAPLYIASFHALFVPQRVGELEARAY